ncbi:hypothetical protein LINGRAHAP2_LOCUS11094 [Linum grandiflorum]
MLFEDDLLVYVFKLTLVSLLNRRLDGMVTGLKWYTKESPLYVCGVDLRVILQRVVSSILLLFTMEKKR